MAGAGAELPQKDGCEEGGWCQHLCSVCAVKGCQPLLKLTSLCPGVKHSPGATMCLEPDSRGAPGTQSAPANPVAVTAAQPSCPGRRSSEQDLQSGPWTCLTRLSAEISALGSALCLCPKPFPSLHPSSGAFPAPVPAGSCCLPALQGEELRLLTALNTLPDVCSEGCSGC